jgi:hypothetical protein
MFPSVVCRGKPEIQLPDKNQLGETAPVQLDWACVETVDAAKSAIVVSKVDKANLQPARAREARIAGRVWRTDAKLSRIPARHSPAITEPSRQFRRPK